METPASPTVRASDVFGLAVACCLLLAASTAPAYTIVVPDDQPTIQQGIDASVDGDTVLVMPGTYVENILIYPDIVVRSAEGPAVTIIDGSQPVYPDTASVVRFYIHGSIEGFDVRNGAGTGTIGAILLGGGVYVDNVWDPNTEDGPLIMGNWIHNNWLDTFPDAGAGIHVGGVARIVGNRTFNNGFSGAGEGAAIAVHRSSSIALEPVVVQDNEIYDNHSSATTPGRREGTVSIRGGVVAGNVIACNTGGQGTGLSVAGQTSSNTVAGNWSFTEEAAVVLGFSTCWGPEIFTSNNVTDNFGPGVECVQCPGGDEVFLGCNNISGNFPGGQVIGICLDAIGQDGNISVVPLYGRIGCEPGYDYWCLSENSPLLIDPPPGCGLIGALGLCPPVGIRDTQPVAPRHLQVSSPHPNPFTNRTTIPFYLAKDGEVEVQIYDVLGRRIRTLAAGWLVTGDHLLEWDARTESGRRAASGAYVARIRAGGEELTRTLLLVR